MATYRLLNNIFEYHEPVIEFKTFRKQFDGVKLWFNQDNESLLDKLQADWIPIDIQFSSDRNNNNIPDISIWNLLYGTIKLLIKFIPQIRVFLTL